MKVLIVNASPHAKGHNFTAAEHIAKRLAEHNIQSEIYWLGQKPVKACLGCDGCMRRDKCVQEDDDINLLAAKIKEADGLVTCAPVYFGGPNGALCNAYDRVFYSHTVKNQLFASKPAAAVTVCNTMGAETALMGIYRYYATAQMPIIGGMGYTTLTMKMCEETDERFFTVVNAVADNMAKMIKK